MFDAGEKENLRDFTLDCVDTVSPSALTSLVLKGGKKEFLFCKEPGQIFNQNGKIKQVIIFKYQQIIISDDLKCTTEEESRH